MLRCRFCSDERGRGVNVTVLFVSAEFTRDMRWCKKASKTLLPAKLIQKQSGELNIFISQCHFGIVTCVHREQDLEQSLLSILQGCVVLYANKFKWFCKYRCWTDSY